MSRIVILAFVLALTPTHGLVAADAPAGQAETQRVRGFERFQEWSRLVWAHTPGELDDPARIVSAWSPRDLSSVRADLWALVTLVNGGPSPGAMVQYTGVGALIRPTQMARPSSPPRVIKIEDVRNLLALSGARGQALYDEADVTSFMKRAAMLHTDVAMLSPPSAGLAGPPAAADRASTTRRVVDGEDTGWDARPIHWEFARTALDGVRPSPGADPLVAAWYRATSAYMEFRREYGYLTPHLSRGRAILPQDAHLQLYTGVVHEAYAAPVVQAALQTLSSRAFQPAVKSSSDELKLAEGFFRRALDLDPNLGIARVHLGRVLSLLGRSDQSASELRRALSTLTDPRQRYYAELFLGAAEQTAGRASEARLAFERASVLFPNAQAPHLALGQLAWQAADRAGAELAFERLAGLPGDQERREDPWWTYELSAVLDVAVLVENLRQLALEHVKK